MKLPLLSILVAGFTAIGGMPGDLSAQTPTPTPPAKEAAQEYRITLRSAAAPHQVATPDDKRKNWFVEPGLTFGGASGKRFLVQKFERKTVPDPVVGEMDKSEMTVLDQATGKVLVLVMGEAQTVNR
ncbi:hypothetical protein [Verrucomicrobium sp. BvORR106]|uniref:hypothetical protein n=1 Tax=Verrucomicrobium sp. BvORR106 TaxID=1403819 RepID=UPI000571E3FE|nr:hypothetical protein [Verrucomicrobium sp. BvORR106]